MAPTIPTREPISFTAGDTVQWTKIVPDYPPSDGWALDYSLILSDTRIRPTVTDDGVSQYSVTFAAADLSTTIVETEARLVGTVEGSGTYAGQRRTVYDGRVTILPNPTETTLDDARSPAQIELTALNAVILELTESGTSAYAIGGRSATKLDLPKLYQRQAVLEARIRSEQGFGFRQRRVAFVGAG